MPRYEAHLKCPGLELASFQQQLNGVAGAIGAELNWLDKRNATIALLLQPQGISVRREFAKALHILEKQRPISVSAWIRQVR